MSKSPHKNIQKQNEGAGISSGLQLKNWHDDVDNSDEEDEEVGVGTRKKSPSPSRK